MEQLGVARSRKAAERASLALLLLDGAAPLDAEDEAAMAVAEKVPHLLVVVNKSDLPRKLDIGALAHRFDNCPSPAKTGEGMAALCEAIGEQFPAGTGPRASC